MTASSVTTMIDGLDDQKCYRLKSTAAVKLLETKLTYAGRSFKTNISVTKKHGRQFIVQLLD